MLTSVPTHFTRFSLWFFELMLQVMKALATDSKGVMVHASTLGALEALLQFLREGAVPMAPVAPFELDVVDRLIGSQLVAQRWLKSLFVILTVLTVPYVLPSTAQSASRPSPCRTSTSAPSTRRTSCAPTS